MSFLDRFCVLIATGFGLGFSPFAPGTVGTLGGIPLTLAIAQLPGEVSQVAVIVALCALGVPVCTRAARALGGIKDPGAIVWDEIASLPITFLFLPLDWRTIVLGFLLHRVFDITKPPPARQLERLPDGLGIMADDWIAGIYSNLALRVVLKVLSS